MRDIRLGDDIDDYCVRCKRVMNHAVVSVIAAAPAKVRCRICHSDHDYRHEQAPPPKVDARKAALFSEVLKKVNPAAVEADAEIAVEVEFAEDLPVEEAGIEEPLAEDPPVVVESPKPKAKAKSRSRK
jgi:hypothetical protein